MAPYSRHGDGATCATLCIVKLLLENVTGVTAAVHILNLKWTKHDISCWEKRHMLTA